MSTEPLKICNECKGPIVDTSRRRFCSVACMRAWHNTNAKKPAAAIVPKELSNTSRPTCPFCHKPMSPQASTYGAYCSELCRHKAAEDNDEEVVQQVKAAEKSVAAATPAPAQHKGICKKCNIFFTTKTLPVRMYCTDECRRQALKDGDFKPGNPHKPAVVEAAPPTSTPPVPATSPTLPRRSLGDVYVATKTKLRRGLVAVLQGALNKLTN